MNTNDPKKLKGAELLSPAEAARELGVTYCTLNSWRAKGCPCKMVETGLREVARYCVRDVLAWKKRHRADMLKRKKSAMSCHSHSAK